MCNGPHSKTQLEVPNNIMTIKAAASKLMHAHLNSKCFISHPWGPSRGRTQHVRLPQRDAGVRATGLRSQALHTLILNT